MVESTSRGRTGLGIRGNKCISISGFSRLAMCMAITLAQSPKGMNLLGMQTAKVAGSSGGNKRWK
jgi:hypothetical protein